MAFKDLQKTKYEGLYYYTHKTKGKVYVARFVVKGKKYRKIVGFSNDQFRTNEKLAFLKKEELKNEAINGNYSNKEFTCQNVWDLYYDHIVKSKSNSEKTIKTKLGHWNNYLKKHLEKLKIKQTIPADIQKPINEVLNKKKNKDSGELLKPKTAQNILNTVSAMYSFAIKNQLTDNNPCLHVDLPSFDNARDFPLNTEESKRLFLTIIYYEELIYRGIFTFLVHGRRLNEVLSMAPFMVDIDKNIYNVKCDINKAKKNMIYQITPELREVFLNVSLDPNRDYIFINPKTGTKYVDVSKAWKRIKKAANIDKHLTIHDLRHLIGEVSVNDLDIPLETIAAMLGQTTLNVTPRYSKVRTRTAARGLEKVFNFLKEKNTDERFKELEGLGLKLNMVYQSYILDDINIAIVDIKTMSDETYTKLIDDIKDYLEK